MLVHCGRDDRKTKHHWLQGLTELHCSRALVITSKSGFSHSVLEYLTLYVCMLCINLHCIDRIYPLL